MSEGVASVIPHAGGTGLLSLGQWGTVVNFLKYYRDTQLAQLDFDFGALEHGIDSRASRSVSSITLDASKLVRCAPFW